jgi:hypothetical protein
MTYVSCCTSIFSLVGAVKLEVGAKRDVDVEVANEVEVAEALSIEDETLLIEEGDDLFMDDDVEDEALLIDKDDVAFVFDLTRVGTNAK